MSGHSKWHSIKHKKGAEDAKRGKIFTKHAKLIAIAARGGGDPDMNPSLRMAIENARAENMPRDAIDRAIKKGTGESKDGVQMEEIIYEGYGPGGVALFIETLTDNRNRTVTALKLNLSKNGGTLGAAGSVAYMFKKRGLILVPATLVPVSGTRGSRVPDSKVAASDVQAQISGKNAEEIELAAIDAGAEDVKVMSDIGDSANGQGEHSPDMVQIYTDPHDLMKIKSQLESGGMKIESASLTYIPQTEVTISDENVARQIIELINIIEEDDDVTQVYSNFDIPEAVLEKIA